MQGHGEPFLIPQWLGQLETMPQGPVAEQGHAGHAAGSCAGQLKLREGRGPLVLHHDLRHAIHAIHNLVDVGESSHDTRRRGANDREIAGNDTDVVQLSGDRVFGVSETAGRVQHRGSKRFKAVG